jgi:HAD superfamily hydrolase (TIGR01509 family)
VVSLREAALIEAVVFDLDGVLIDSEPVWAQVREEVVVAHGGHWSPDAQPLMMGMSTAEWSAYMVADLGVRLPPAEVARVVIEAMAARYREHLPLLPGALEAVGVMGSRFALGLASSAPRSLIGTVLDTSGLRSSFAAVRSTEEEALGKPAPDVYLTVADLLGVPPLSCAAVEDSSNGLLSAAAAGYAVIAVPRAEYPPAPDALAVARLVLGGLPELTVEAVTALG